MNVLGTILTLLCLGACGPVAPTLDGTDFTAGWGQSRQVNRDVAAIMQGIDRAKAENERLSRAARDPALARPGS
jgi:hypothetical protein